MPFDCDEFARQALYTLLANIEELRADHNDELRIEGIVANQFSSRSKLPTRLVDELRHEGKPVLEQTLSSSVRVKESHAQHKPMISLERRTEERSVGQEGVLTGRSRRGPGHKKKKKRK